jgi:uncharacterized Zn finger protein (UPF0148 family)
MIEVWCPECKEPVGEFPEDELYGEVECPNCQQLVEIS